MPTTSATSKGGLFTVLAVLLLAWPPCQAQAETFRSPSDGIQSMVYEDGRLSLDARNASLDKLLKEVARMARLTVVADAPIEGNVTVYADRVPLEKALRKILRGIDTSFVYTAKAGASPAEYEVAEVRIYLAKTGQGETRRYSYARNRADETEDRSRSARRPGRGRGAVPRSPSAIRPPPPPIGSTEEARRLITELMQGNLDELDDIAERLKAQNPEVEAQIEEFLESLEEVTSREAFEGQAPIPSLEGLGSMQNLMEQMRQRRRISPGQEE